MPPRMLHYLIAEKVAEQVKIENLNRFKIGSLCPDMSCREDESKNCTHYFEINYILRNGFGLVYNLEEDRNLELEGLHPELYAAALAFASMVVPSM